MSFSESPRYLLTIDDADILKKVVLHRRYCPSQHGLACPGAKTKDFPWGKEARE